MFTAWTEKADKLIAKIKNAAADKDPIADRNNQEQAKRLEVELKKLEERSRVLEAEREGKL
jgi:hypothetical protein